MRHVLTSVMIDAQPLAELKDETRAALGIEDARKSHIGIFHVVTGQLLNTMEPEQFHAYYAPLEQASGDTPAFHLQGFGAATPAAAASETHAPDAHA